MGQTQPDTSRRPGMTHGSTGVVASRSFSTGHVDATAVLAAAGPRVVTGPPDHALSDLAALLADAVVWIAGVGPITGDHLAAAPGLRVIARYGVGVDAVDLAAAAARGVVVTNTPGANIGAVADHTIALLLAALRGITMGDQAVRSGSWQARELSMSVVGIVGLGRIGRAVASRLGGFGATILAHDPMASDEEMAAAGVSPVSATAIRTECDIVTRGARRRAGARRRPALRCRADVRGGRPVDRGRPGGRQPAAGREPARANRLHPARRGCDGRGRRRQ